MDADRRRAVIARNEAQFRDINERLEAGLRRVPHPPELLEFVCECGDRTCDALVRLTFDEYEDVRRDSRHFAVLPGHVFEEAEHVVRRTGRFHVVEKIGDTVDIADAADRRASGHAGRRGGDDPPTSS